MYRSILVPTDGSDCSQNAVEHALKLASLAGASVSFIYVQQDIYPLSMTEFDSYSLYAEQLKGDLEKAGKVALEKAEASAKAAGVHCDCRQIEHGIPADAICEAASGYDLVVIGGHGRSGMKRLLLGSVSEQIIRHTSQPVLVVHCGEED